MKTCRLVRICSEMYAGSQSASIRSVATLNNRDIYSEHKDSVTTIVINRAHRKNAIDRATAERLAAAIREFEGDEKAKVGVLWGAGGTFCSGADLTAISQGDFNRLEDKGDGPLGPSRMMVSKPLIAAVSGYAVAGGLELACLCDLRVVEEDAVLGVFCRRFGVPLIDGGTVRLPRLIGTSRALDLILTGRAVSADEALAMGLANRIVPTGTARERAEQLAAEIASHPQACMLSDRRSVYEQQGLPLPEAIANEFQISKKIVSKDMLQHVANFTTKKYR